MRRIVLVSLVVLLSGYLCACSRTPENTKVPDQPPAPEKPVVPPELQAAAEAVLGAETEILLWGDLAGNGRQQALAINRLQKPPGIALPGTLITRATILELDGGHWREIFRCDQHLRNPKGYLGGTPVAPVNGWRLQYEQNPGKGLALYFTPLTAPSGGYLQTIGVRWNRKAGRYQALDRNFEVFQGENPTLEEVR
jgi:hypothetical protein